MKARKFIRDPFRTVLSPGELEEIEALEAKGNMKVLHLSEADWAKFTELFTYDTNAIEGSTVNEAEVVSILEKDEPPKNRAEYEIQETYGVSEAVDHIRKAKEHVSLDLIKRLHEIVFKNSKPFAGLLREKGKEVAVVNRLGEVIHRGAPSEHVAVLLEELAEWYNKNKRRYTPIVLAAVVHNQFENIHPFEDGNGRVGRLLLNNILLKHNLPPVNIELRKRTEYYEALQEYEKNGNLRPTIELIIKEYKSLKKQLSK